MHALQLETLQLTKRFGAFTALDGVSLTARPGTVHALLGENGAGKSTLVKCVVGYQKPDDGAVLVDGRERDIHSPTVARDLGIGMVYQHFTVVPGMTVAENLLLARGRLPAVIDWNAARAELGRFLETTPFRLDLDATPLDLSAGEKQKLEILKQLFLKPRLLILDEPTSVLTPQEADEVLGALRDRAHAGDVTVVMITHKFREVTDYADDVSVLRHGRLMGSGRVVETDPARLAALMMGEGVAAATTGNGSAPTPAILASTHGDLAVPLTGVAARDGTAVDPRRPAAPEALRGATPGVRPPAVAGEAPAAGVAADAGVPVAREPKPPGAVRLAVRALRVLGDRAEPAVRGLDLEVRAGEIVGVAGVSGNGQRELMEALTGQRARESGSVRVAAEAFDATRAQNWRLKVRSLPEEPLRNACVGEMSVAHNIGLRRFDQPPAARAGWLRPAALKARARELIASYGVKTQGEGAQIRSLSGGNVQRAVLARELSDDAELLLVSNPVFGLDFKAVAEVHARLIGARNRGAAVLLVSEDLDELLALADRIVVMSEGRIVFACDARGADRRTLGHHMGGHGADHGPAAVREAVAA